jgi:hypothetical protein
VSDLQRKLWNAGFTRESTGGGCYAYFKTISGNRYLFLTDADGTATDCADDDFIVGLEEDGTQLAYILRDGSRSLTEVENYAGNPTIDPTRDYPTIESALAAFGVQI